MTESLQKISQRGALFLLKKIEHEHEAIKDTVKLYERAINDDMPSDKEWRENIEALSLARARALALSLALSLARARARDRARAQDLARARAQDLAWPLVDYLLELLGDRVPKFDNLNSRILSDIGLNGFTLEMGHWHTCETTHCRAGFCEFYAGEQGKELVKYFNHWLTGAMIHKKSTGVIPDFYASNEDALADIKKQAALEKEK